MKRVRINQGKVGLVFRRGDYDRLLQAGSHRVRLLDEVVTYDLTKEFNPGVDLALLLKDDALKNALTIVQVGDQEIALKYENGIFCGVLTSGRYAFWKGVIDYRFDLCDMSELDVPSYLSKDLLMRRELQSYLRIHVVEKQEQGLLFVNGNFDRVLDTGIYYFWKNALVVSVLKTDMRNRQIEVAGQEILTKDKAALRVNFSAQYRITDIEVALLENENYAKQLYSFIQLALREFIGTRSLDELLERKESVSTFVMNELKSKTKDLGVELTDCGIKDVILPGEVKEIMNQVLVAQKQAQANTITRREETASTRSLLNTAKLMEENQMLYKLKEMEYVEKIAERINSISLSGGNQIVDQLKDIFT